MSCHASVVVFYEKEACNKVSANYTVIIIINEWLTQGRISKCLSSSASRTLTDHSAVQYTIAKGRWGAFHPDDASVNPYKPS